MVRVPLYILEVLLKIINAKAHEDSCSMLPFSQMTLKRFFFLQ